MVGWCETIIIIFDMNSVYYINQQLYLLHVKKEPQWKFGITFFNRTIFLNHFLTI